MINKLQNKFPFLIISLMIHTMQNIGVRESSPQQLADEDSSEDEESYDPSNEDAPPTASIDAFQTECGLLLSSSA